MNIGIRKEQPEDYREVENVTREAFWNLHVPGCDEHFLAHIMREHEDFLDDYTLVAVDAGKIVGSIMYTRSKIVADNGEVLDTLTFGPIGVLPAYQRKSIGTKLIQTTVAMAKTDNVPAIIIEGHPHNYCRHGFKGSFNFSISDSEGRYPLGLLVLELTKDVFAGKQWKYYRSPVYTMDYSRFEEFDNTFPMKEKGYRISQEEFAIGVRAYIPDVESE